MLRTPLKKQAHHIKIRLRRLFAGAVNIGASLALSSCTPSSQSVELEAGQVAFKNKNYKSAIEHFDKVIQKGSKAELSLIAAQKIAEISEMNTHDYQKALSTYKFIIVNSSLDYERVDAQKKMANLYFNQLADYKQSITEYSRLLELPHSPKETLLYRMNLARAYYYQANIFQALVEIDVLLKESHDENVSFEGMLLKANIFLGAKRLEEAVTVVKEILSKYPEKSKLETVPLMLAVCYEEQNNFIEAIATLEQLRANYPNKAFIDKRIRALKERQSLLPGAHGLKK